MWPDIKGLMSLLGPTAKDLHNRSRADIHATISSGYSEITRRLQHRCKDIAQFGFAAVGDDAEFLPNRLERGAFNAKRRAKDERVIPGGHVVFEQR